MSTLTWSREAWDASISARAYNADWWDTLTPETEPKLWAELARILRQELALESIPDWALEIVARMLELPMCGYYGYPANVTQVVDAIAAEHSPDIVMTCYTVTTDRKILMSYYVFCLDAWSKDAPLEQVIADLALRDPLGRDWDKISSAIYGALGTTTELKTVVVERLIHRLRWWIKTLIWSDDKRDRFLLDVYSGDIRGDEEKFGAYGNAPYGDPYFAELRLPHVKAMEARIRAEAPDGKELLDRIQSTWLCAPKVFRYLEKLVVEIGAIDSGSPPTKCPPILQCEDTYPDFDATRQHFSDLLDRLQLWLDGQGDAVSSLGEATPVKRWLVHLLRHKLAFHSTYEENFAKFMGARAHGKSGTRIPTD